MKYLKVFLLVMILFLVGCTKKNDNILNDLNKKLDNSKSYYITGNMEITNNEDTYTYDIEVSYQKKDYYKISLTNKLNNHKQVILRNDDGVYVITPSLNKSYKFQSDWPYNNSQVYLLSSVYDDLNNDNDRTYKDTKDGYLFTSKVNYPNNKALVKQNVYVKKNLLIDKVEVVDKDGNVGIKMNFEKIEFDKKFDDDYFKLSSILDIKNDNKKNSSNAQNNSNQNDSGSNNTVQDNNNSSNSVENNSQDNTNGSNNSQNNTGNNYDNNNNSTNGNNNQGNVSGNENTNSNDATNSNVSGEEKQTKTTATIKDVVYPMYLPANTYLASEKTINTDDGERLILTFDGDSSFTLVEEVSSISDENLIIPVTGSMEFLSDVIGVVGTNSITWDSNGIEYYMVSNTIPTSELINIAKSISVLPVSK